MSNREGDRRSEPRVTFKYEARVEAAPGEYVVLPDDHGDLAALLSGITATALKPRAMLTWNERFTPGGGPPYPDSTWGIRRGLPGCLTPLPMLGCSNLNQPGVFPRAPYGVYCAVLAENLRRNQHYKEETAYA